MGSSPSKKATLRGNELGWKREVLGTKLPMMAARMSAISNGVGLAYGSTAEIATTPTIVVLVATRKSANPEAARPATFRLVRRGMGRTDIYESM